MKYLIALTLGSFVCICFLAASTDLGKLKIADWTNSNGSDAVDDSSELAAAPEAGFDSAASGSPKLVLMKFGATWCPPCRMIDQELKMLAKSDLPVEIRKIDVDQRADLAGRYNVTSIPRLILLEDGREVGDVIGYRSQEELAEWIQDSASPAALAGEKHTAGPAVVKANPFVD